jgi:transcription initiation factor IIE alpha subunit
MDARICQKISFAHSRTQRTQYIRRLWTFENRVLKRKLKPEVGEVTEGRKTPQIDDRNTFYCSTRNITVSVEEEG